MDILSMPQRLLVFLRPPIPPLTDDAGENKNYMRKVAKYHLNVSIALFSLVGFSVWGASSIGFARSADIDTRFDEKIQPIKLSILEQQAQTEQLRLATKQVSEAQAANSKLLRLSLGNNISSEIRRFQLRVCTSKDSHDREFFRREIERKQDEFHELKGYEYKVPECTAL